MRSLLPRHKRALKTFGPGRRLTHPIFRKAIKALPAMLHGHKSYFAQKAMGH